MNDEFIGDHDDGRVGDLAGQMSQEPTVKSARALFPDHKLQSLHKGAVTRALFSQPRPDDLWSRKEREKRLVIQSSGESSSSSGQTGLWGEGGGAWNTEQLTVWVGNTRGTCFGNGSCCHQPKEVLAAWGKDMSRSQERPMLSESLLQGLVDNKMDDGFRDASVRGSDPAVKASQALRVINAHGALEAAGASLVFGPAENRKRGRELLSSTHLMH